MVRLFLNRRGKSFLEPHLRAVAAVAVPCLRRKEDKETPERLLRRSCCSPGTQADLGAQLQPGARGETQAKLLDQAGGCGRRRAGFPLPGEPLQRHHRFQGTHHRQRSRSRRGARLRLCAAEIQVPQPPRKRQGRDAQSAVCRRRCPGQYLRHRLASRQGFRLRQQRQVQARHRQPERRRRIFQAPHGHCGGLSRAEDLHHRHAAQQDLRHRHAGQRAANHRQGGHGRWRVQLSHRTAAQPTSWQWSTR